ncbi:hypothetical protein SELMODRAFT_122361 [Selaginella moellendorffii]|uniref:Chalcone synthase n=2 Tax=Selaginella moellendorffii TaxID=88036 RepID=D8SQD7_SELML|nr:hypothetical protein SELMODRAFT_235157 [Selaginella moellendorffii]EFJ13445.1 hypothetical protein SELMODRAFT_122361 [Selaginella moellendorffii]
MSNGSSSGVKRKNLRAARPGKATLLAFGKALPDTVVKQEYLVDGYFRDTKVENAALKEKLQRLCKTTTVKTRYVVMSKEILENHPEFYTPGTPSIRQRLEIAGEAVTKMGVAAATQALAEWGRPISDITHLVYVSSSEVRFPGGDLYLSKHLGLSSDISRVMLYMLGCCGGAGGLRVSKDLAENNPGSRILLVISDTTLIGWRPPNPQRPYDLVGAALFGDGASAVVIGADPLPSENPCYELVTASQCFVPGSEKTIDGRLTEDGIIFSLGRELPQMIESEVEGFIQGLLKRSGRVEAGGVDYDRLFWAIHPGGPAILNACEKKLQLAGDKLKCSRQVLSDYGNINGSTIIYVLDYMRQVNAAADKPDPEWGVILAFGPGVTMEGMVARNLVA